MAKTIRETGDSPEGRGWDPRSACVLRAQQRAPHLEGPEKDEPVRLPGGSGVYTEV